MPDISVIIPVYNRGDLIRYTLESLRRASPGLAVETIVVDDGSTSPVAEDLARLGYATDVKLIRQANQGLLFARLNGFATATGRHTLFLDSDDLIAPEKLRKQIQAMESGDGVASYSDSARCELKGDYESLLIAPDEPSRRTADLADFFINIQPAPHSPVFRTDFLRTVVSQAFFPPSPLYNSVAEIWFYHNAAPRPGRVIHVPGPLTIVAAHAATRLTSHWERLAVASLGVMEAFARTVPATPDRALVRRYVAEKAFRSWRRLPRDFSPTYQARLLALWSNLAGDSRSRESLGGSSFQGVSRLIGPVATGRLFRRWQNRRYEAVRTLPDQDLEALLGALPPP